MTYEIAVGLVTIDSFFGSNDRNDGGSIQKTKCNHR